MNDKFAQFIAPAQQKPGLLRFLFGLVFLVALYAGLLFLVLCVLALFMVRWNFADLGSGLEVVSMLVTTPDYPPWMLMVLSTFLAMFAAIWVTTLLFRRQGLRSLIGPGPVLQNFIRAALVILLLGGIGVLSSFVLHDPQPNIAFSSWLFWMLPALPLLLIQISAEELIFRGYLMQELAVRFKSRLVWFLLPAIIFGLLHYEPVSFGDNAWLVVIATTILGLVTADLTIRTGNLGAALGLHFANNFIAMMVLSLDGTMNGLSLWVTDIHVSDTQTVRNLLMIDIGLIIVAYLVFLTVIRLKQRD